MGVGTSKINDIKVVNFEDVKLVKKNNYVLINTLPKTQQDCLIENTILIDNEETVVENAINNKQTIIIYGINSNDYTIYKKYDQILGLGHMNTYIYIGGLFEWLLLQDIYGTKNFKTTKYILDHLKYKPNTTLDIYLLKN
tara:strand:+ start:4335 stop:4754 length:420 start_codon:yes stop_codon:yes gene_type:complete